MEIDISSVIEAISMFVDFIKEIKFTFGGYTFSLWMIVVALGTIESISFILEMRKNSDK